MRRAISVVSPIATSPDQERKVNERVDDLHERSSDPDAPPHNRDDADAVKDDQEPRNDESRDPSPLPKRESRKPDCESKRELKKPRPSEESDARCRDAA